MEESIKEKDPGMKEKMTGGFWKNKWFWLAILFFAGLSAILYVSLLWADSEHQEELLVTKIEYEERANLTLQQNTREHVSLMLKTFVWAVRSSMIRENLDEVDQYFTELVKQEKINEIVLADSKGKVLLSTNKKRQGKKFSDFYPGEMLQYQEVHFRTADDTIDLFASAPVFSLNTRLGTIFIDFEIDEIDLDQELEEEDSEDETEEKIPANSKEERDSIS